MRLRLIALFLITFLFSHSAWCAPTKAGDQIIVDEYAVAEGGALVPGGVWNVLAADSNGRVVIATPRGTQFVISNRYYKPVLAQASNGLKAGSKIIVDEYAAAEGGSTLSGGIWEVKAIDSIGRVVVQTPRGTEFVLSSKYYKPVLAHASNGLKAGSRIIVDENAAAEGGTTLSGGIWEVKAIDSIGRVVVESSKGTQFVLSNRYYKPVLTAGLNGLKSGDKIILNEGAVAEGGYTLQGGLHAIKAVDTSGRVILETEAGTQFVVNPRYFSRLCQDKFEKVANMDTTGK